MTDAGGDGSMAYNNSTGVITYTGPSQAEVAAHFVAGGGITFDSGEGRITNAGVTRIVAGTRISVSDSIGAVTITNNISAGTGLSFDGSTLNASVGSADAAQSSATAVGSYILGVSGGTGSYSAGSTISGGSLYYAGLEFPYSFTSGGSYTNDGARIIANSQGVGSGTWRAHFRTPGTSSHYAWGVWQRIS